MSKKSSLKLDMLLATAVSLVFMGQYAGAVNNVDTGSVAAIKSYTLENLKKIQSSREIDPNAAFLKNFLKDQGKATKGGNVSGGGDDPLELVGILPENRSEIISYQLKLTSLDKLQQAGLNGDGIGVAVLDSGLNPDSRSTSNLVHFEDMTGECSSGLPCDSAFHGSLVSDLIVQSSPKARLVSLKVLSANQQGDFSSVIRGLKWVLNNYKKYGIRIVNLSLVTSSQLSGYWNKVDEARKILAQLDHEGLFIVSAVGNDFKNKISVFPADTPESITVGSFSHFFSSDRNDFIPSDFSNKGFAENPSVVKSSSLFGTSTSRDFNSWIAKPDALAPGDSVFACIKSCYLASGTSFASGIVSGGIAALLQALPEMKRKDFVDAIQLEKLPPSQVLHPDYTERAYAIDFGLILRALNQARKNPNTN